MAKASAGTPGYCSDRALLRIRQFRALLVCWCVFGTTAPAQAQHHAEVCNTDDRSDCQLIDTSVMGALKFEDYRVSSPNNIQYDPQKRLIELAALEPSAAKTLCAAYPVGEFVNSAPTISFTNVRAQIRETSYASGNSITTEEFLAVQFSNLSTSDGYTSPAFGFKMSRPRGSSQYRIAFRPDNPGLENVTGLTNEVVFAIDPSAQTATFFGPPPASAPLRQALFGVVLHMRSILDAAAFTTEPAPSGLPLWSAANVNNLADQAGLVMSSMANPNVPIAPKTGCVEGPYAPCVGTENMVAFQNVVMMWGGEYLGLRTNHSIAVLMRNLLAWAKVSAPILDPASSVPPLIYKTMEFSKPLTMLWPTLRNDPSIASADRQTVDNWITNRLLPVAFVPGGTGGGYPFTNNWGYFGGSIQMADAIRRSDHQMFATAIQTFYVALHQMRNDGSFPMEVRRSACSATYQNVAILHLVSMAEMAATQGYDLYGMSVNGKKLESAIQFLLDAYANPALINQYSQQGGGVCFEGKPGDPADFSFISNSRSPSPSALAWAESYLARFPASPNAARLRQILGTDIARDPRPMFHSYIGLNSSCSFHKAYPSNSVKSVSEFYNASLDHYFITWVADEIDKLDNGTFKGWARTGLSFNAYTAAQSVTSAVCRIYIPPGKGDGHFFGRDTNECDGTMARNATFTLESPAFFHLFPSTSGNCAAGTVPVYRVYSNRADANHRYTTDRAVRNQMVTKGWLAEGDGPDVVVMCAPQ